MNDRFVDHTISDFCSKLASIDPTPGGGTAAALAGLLSASLIEMVLRLSLRKRPDSAALAETLAGMPAIRESLAALMDDDSAAYDKVMAAFKLPKATDAEKQVRSSEIQAATIRATQVPMRTARACAELLDRNDALSTEIFDAARSDWSVAREFARTGLSGGLANVDINLSSIKDPDIAAGLRAEAAELRKRL